MIAYFLTVGHQILIMFLLVVAGYIMHRIGWIDEKGIKQMSVVLLKLVIPMILISSFQRKFEKQLFNKWAVTLMVSVISYAVQIGLGQAFYHNKDAECNAESNLSVVLPNNGFLAFPIMIALVGELGVFLGSTNVILLNIIQWTYGVKLFAPNEKLDWKKIIFNPGSLSIILGLMLFVSPYKLPTPVFEAVDAIGSLNTPLAMIILGGLIAESDLKNSLKNLQIYKISAIKLIMLPVIMGVILSVLPIEKDVKLVGFICSVTPTATSVSMLSQLCDKNYKFATNTVVVCTILSAFTMPLILSAGKVILGY